MTAQRTPNLDNIRLWAEALESGEYQQVKGSLQFAGRYCCLGVACEVAIKHGVPVKRGNSIMAGVASYDNATGALPVSVQEWLGVPANPFLKDDVATNWNDSRGASFGVIAEAIREEFGIEKAA